MHSKRPFLVTCLLGASLITAQHAQAAGPYDPDVSYLSLTTPRFEIVAPKAYEHIAIRAGTIAELILDDMQKRYGYELSGRTTIVVNDQTDFANGSARIYQSKVITIYVTAPTEVSGLEDYDDWLQAVITHELSHVLHLDMNFGLPWLGRKVFGKWVALNQYAAAWFTEGLAVYEETMASGSGRGRSSLVEMFVRTAALADQFPQIDQAYRSHANWPFGNIAYFFGGRFQQWLAAKHGEKALMHFHRAYASTPIPYLSWLAAEIAFDTSLESEWSNFEAAMTVNATTTLAKIQTSTIPMSKPIRLTHFGGQVLGPKITPDGKSIIFSTSSLVDGPRIRRIDLEGKNEEVLLEDTLSKAISFTPDGSAFYFQQTQINQRYYTHNSLLRYDLKQNRSTLVQPSKEKKKDFLAPSGSLRARDPDISSNGKYIVFVQTPYGANQLVLAELESDGVTIKPRIIVPAQPDVQLSNPRFSPQGNHIAVSRFKAGRRDIIIYNVSGQIVHRVTNDRALDIDPTWSSDGQWLIFSSDRSGIYNLYAYHVDRGEFRQLTNLSTGAFQACLSPDQKRVVFRGYSVDGFDIYTMPLNLEDAPISLIQAQTDTKFDNSVRQGPAARQDVIKQPPPPAPFKDTPLPENLPANWKLTPYSAASTLLPFQDNWNLLPSIFFTENNIVGQLSHFATDALQTQSYALWTTYELESNFVGGGATYINNQLFPTFSFSAQRSARSYSIFDPEKGYIGNFYERLHIGRFGTTVPIKQRHALGFSFTFEERAGLGNNDPQVLSFSEQLPSLGNYARVQMGYSYQNIRFFPHSISPERGWSTALALDALSKGLGSDYEQMMFHAEARGYWSIPYRPRWLKNHVIAMRAALGVSAGPDLADTFRLGGVGGQSAISTTTQNFFPLRGIRTASKNGPGLLTGTLEYRAPILRIERGLGTIPLVFRVIHLAAFADFGKVFDRIDAQLFTQESLRSASLSVGGEIRADILVFWALGLRLRAGYAKLLHTDNIRLDNSGFFFQIGSTF